MAQVIKTQINKNGKVYTAYITRVTKSAIFLLDSPSSEIKLRRNGMPFDSKIEVSLVDPQSAPSDIWSGNVILKIDSKGRDRAKSSFSNEPKTSSMSPALLLRTIINMNNIAVI